MSSAHPVEPERRITRKIPATQLVALLLAFVLVAGAGGLIGAGMLIPLAAGMDTTVDSGVELFEEVPAELEPSPLAEQSRIFASDGKTLLARIYEQNRIVKPLDEISDHMEHAAVAIEDERFWKHNGVDPQGMVRAAVSNTTGGNTQGASTLTQQYVKNVLIEEALKERDPFGVLEARESTIQRKLREAKLAIALEKKMSKEEILMGYLNIAQFGESIYGVEVAAQRYFSKSAAHLSIVEAATIAGVTKEPSGFDPLENPERNEERRNLVLHKMYSLGYIEKDEMKDAQSIPIKETLKPRKLQLGCQEAPAGSAFFCDYVVKDFLLHEEFGKTRDDRYALLYRGGVDIVTTLNVKMQKAADETINAAVPAGNGYGLEAAITSVEPGTGRIKSMAQNVPYDPAAEPAPGHTALNYSADYLHGNSRGFQVGSNFKPFVLAEWLRSGRQLYDPISASNFSAYETTFNASGCQSYFTHQPYPVQNVEGGPSGTVSVLQGTFQSLNTVYTRMSQQLNLCDVQKTAFDVGFRPMTSAVPSFRTIDTPKPSDIDVVASMTLGIQSSTPVNQAAAFATFATGGTYCKPVAILKVTQASGKEMDVPGAECKKTIETDVANTVAWAMQKVFTGQPWGTAYPIKGLADGRQVAGKTGTTQSASQSWFTGYTPNLSTSVWVGEEGGNVPHGNVYLPATSWYNPNAKSGPLYGGTVATPAWRRYMDQAVAGLPAATFAAPNPAMVGSPPPPPRSSGDPDGGGDKGGSEGGGDTGGGNAGGGEKKDG
ncbi:transglycosylase domain-containing protein [Myceligenerans crystallogenes]|uniref:Transglycosylase domain-containing protein n=1 Tax=Myceligenerans crystallogenes TaxID=316335 RepID=A0ABN2N9N4_9MICO